MAKIGRVARTVSTSVFPALEKAGYYSIETVKTVLGVMALFLMTIGVGVVHLIDWLWPTSAEEMNADGTKDQR